MLFLFSWLFASGALAAFPECLKTRCAVDIGSSSIKAQVARVDICSQVVLETLRSERVDVAPRKQSARALIALRRFQSLARERQAEPCRGVATAAFREGKGGEEAARKLTRESATPIVILPAEKEGQLELVGALARAPLRAEEMKRAVVWGLGSTSQQWTPVDKSEPADLRLSSLGFNAQVRGKAASPNPMSKEQVAAARALVDKIVKEAAIPEPLRRKLAAPDVLVLGIGGTLNLSVKKQTGAGDKLTLPAVTHAIEERIGKTDSDPLFFGKEHAPTQLTNLILVEGYLRGLGINEVRLVQTDLTDGILVYPPIWK